MSYQGKGSGATVYLNGTGAYSTPSAGGDLVTYVNPGTGSVNANASFAWFNNISVAQFANNQDGIWVANVKVPSGATSISSMSLFYIRQSTGNLYLKFGTGHVNTDTAGSSIEDDSTDTDTTYAGGAADDSLGIITVPAGAYNGLTNIDADDVVGIRVTRTGSNASDTYEASWNVIGVQITFA